MHAGHACVEPTRRQRGPLTEHMALAVLSIKAGSCYETLKEFSIDPGYVQQLIMQAMGLDAEQVPEWF